MQSLTLEQSKMWTLAPQLKGDRLRRFYNLLLVAMHLALKPSLLVDLKGAPLALWLALALRGDGDHECFPSLARLEADSGYAKPTVVAAVDKLVALKLVTRTRRRRTSNLYKLIPPALPFLAAGDSISKKSLLQESISKKPLPEYNVVVVTEEQKIKEEQQQQKTEDDSKSKESLLQENLRVKNSNSKESDSDQPRQMTFDDDWLPVKDKLVRAGVTETAIPDLLTAVQARGQEPDYVEAWILKFETMQRSGQVHSVGFLVMALSKGWGLSTQDLAKVRGAAAEWRRYIEGEFAEYIQY